VGGLRSEGGGVNINPALVLQLFPRRAPEVPCSSEIATEIVRSPTDLELWKVYSDWLLENDREKGEWLAIVLKMHEALDGEFLFHAMGYVERARQRLQSCLPCPPGINLPRRMGCPVVLSKNGIPVLAPWRKARIIARIQGRNVKVGFYSVLPGELFVPEGFRFTLKKAPDMAELFNDWVAVLHSLGGQVSRTTNRCIRPWYAWWKTRSVELEKRVP
jgi:hypothetical protein